MTVSRAQFLRGVSAFAALGFAGALPASAAETQSVEQFYRGKTITLIIPTAPGGINNLSGRLVARHLHRFIPGNPTIMAENREAGGGLALANSFAMKASRANFLPDCRSQAAR